MKLLFLIQLAYASNIIYTLPMPKCEYVSINDIKEECTYSYNIMNNYNDILLSKLDNPANGLSDKYRYVIFNVYLIRNNITYMIDNYNKVYQTNLRYINILSDIIITKKAKSEVLNYNIRYYPNVTISSITINNQIILEVDYYIELIHPITSRFSLYLSSPISVLTNNTYIGYEIIQNNNRTSNLTYIDNILINGNRIQFNLTFNGLSILNGLYYGNYDNNNIINLHMVNNNIDLFSNFGIAEISKSRYSGINYFSYLYFKDIYINLPYLPIPAQSMFSLKLETSSLLLTNNTYVGYEITQGFNKTYNLTYLNNIIINNNKIQFNLTFNNLPILDGIYYGEYKTIHNRHFIFNLRMINNNINIFSILAYGYPLLFAYGYKYGVIEYFDSMCIDLPYLPMPIQGKYSLILKSYNSVLINNTYIEYEITGESNKLTNLLYINNILINNNIIQFNLSFKNLSILNGVYCGEYNIVENFYTIHNLQMANSNITTLSVIGYEEYNNNIKTYSLYFEEFYTNLPI